MSETANSNPFSDINGLVEALEKAPQDKEGAFRVSTWLMVLKAFQSLKEQIESNKNQLDSTKIPSVEEISSEVQKNLETNLANKDADIILF